MAKILVVDDELSIRESFTLILKDRYTVQTAASGEAALTLAADQKFDLAFLDIRMPGINGLETLRRLKEIDPQLEVIMVTAVNEVQRASEAVKLGARDYLVKPFDVDHVLKLAEQLLRRRAIIAESVNLTAEEARVISRSERSNRLVSSFEQLPENEPVLLVGEAGTEKELMARLLHQKSPRSDQPFVVLNLARQMSEPQIKAALFGQGKAASSAEVRAKTGALEEAGAGTLLINNVDCLTTGLVGQLKSGSFRREGSDQSIKIEARLVGACVEPPAFDFARTVIKLPSLRERPGDIPMQIKHCLEKYNARHNKAAVFSPAALEILSRYSWPGNTLELELLVESLILSAGTFEIKADDLPFNILLETGSGGASIVEKFEQRQIKRVLNSVEGDQNKAAQLLGITSQVLASKV